MSDTQYLAAKTIDEAVQAHNQANGSARFLAGGTDLLVQIKSGIKKPNLVIDVKKIVELNNIEEISENEFIFSARLEIDYINEQYKLNLPESDEYETLAGYIIYLHESIPEKGNTIETAEFSFFITEVSTHKIEIVKVTKI